MLFLNAKGHVTGEIADFVRAFRNARAELRDEERADWEIRLAEGEPLHLLLLKTDFITRNSKSIE